MASQACRHACVDWAALLICGALSAAEHKWGVLPCRTSIVLQRSPWRLRCCLPGFAQPQVRCMALRLSTSPSLAGMGASPLVLPMQTVSTATLQDRTCCTLTSRALLPAGCSGLQGKSLTLFGDHVEHLCCHPGYRMLALRNVPQMPAASVGFTTFTWEGTLKRLRQMQVTGQRLGPCSPSLQSSSLLPWQRVWHLPSCALRISSEVNKQVSVPHSALTVMPGTGAMRLKSDVTPLGHACTCHLPETRPTFCPLPLAPVQTVPQLSPANFGRCRQHSRA